MLIDWINDLMWYDLGFGKIGEFVLIGDDWLMCNDIDYMLDQNDILVIWFDDFVIEVVFVNGEVFGYGILYCGEMMDIEVMCFDYQGKQFVIVVMQSYVEVLVLIVFMCNCMVMVGLVLFFIVVVVGYLVVCMIIWLINNVVNVMNWLVIGDIKVVFDGVD